MAMAQNIIEDLASSFLDLCPALGRDAQRVSIQIYRLLAQGHPVSRAQIAASLQMAERAVDDILDEWPGIFTNDLDQIVGYWGLALPEMDHRFEVNGQVLYTWCAWDALFIPEILQKSAQVVSVCPVSDRTIRLTVTPEGVTRLDPVGTVMSFVTLDRDTFSRDILHNFCHYVHFFASESAGDQWLLKQKNACLLSVEEAFSLGKLKNRSQYAAVLKD